MKIDSFDSFVTTASQVQYLNPVQHREFLSCIASVAQKNVATEPSSALTVSLRIDGSVDYQQIETSMFVLKLSHPKVI